MDQGVSSAAYLLEHGNIPLRQFDLTKSARAAVVQRQVPHDKRADPQSSRTADETVEKFA